MLGEVKVSVDKWRYARIPKVLRNRFLKKKPEKATVHPIGDSLQIKVPRDPADLIIRLELSEWHEEKPRSRSPDGWTVYLNRWEDKLRILEDGDLGEYVPATWAFTVPDKAAFDEDNKIGSASFQAAMPEREGLTSQEANDLVDRFVQNSEMRTTAKSTDVIDAMGIEKTHHNIKEIHDALDDRFEPMNGNSTRAKRFKLNNDQGNS